MDDTIDKVAACPHCHGTGRMIATYALYRDMQGTTTRTGMEQFCHNLAFRDGVPISYSEETAHG